MSRALALALLLAAPSARAATDVYIKLAGQGGAPLLPLALPPFIAEQADKADDALAAKSVSEVVRADLMLSRYFAILEDGPHYDGANLAAILPDWKKKGVSWLLLAKVSSASPRLTISAKLIDANSGEAVFERFYKQDAAYLRAACHRLSDDLVKQLTGKNGIAHTQIAFANDQTGHKEIYAMDYDGANLRQLTRDASIDLLPRFSPDRKLLAFTTYKEGNPDLFVLDLEHAARKPVSQEQGLNVAGGFSPDGTQLLMTLSRQRSPNLYVRSMADGSVTQLTQHFGADSSPTFSPDAGQVAFVSDRSGNPQIYVLDMTTQRAKRLTNLNWCDSPSWSPTGEWIAFAGRVNVRDKLDIYLVDVTGNQIRQLTRLEGSNENPSWSPDGRFLVFTSTRNGKKPELFVMDNDGSAPHRLAEIPGGSVTPNWSF
ncbi:MAG: PD40 domain-containing protein [Elusimicrobia bacterium]|nr:PD40 domain-containing protein [Elusimicrobiota bacterium]